mmetsp:Transcript_9316/g.16343  ORF Transcript_9316/g.16343 Transcript_9316/m.16343 type:complete len:533 (+) Transcript_9316:109-1707(+)
MGKGKKQTGLGLKATKEDNFAAWYLEVITKAELIEYYNVSGCYILRPNAYRMWEEIQRFLDGEIKELGVEPCYFPMFVSKANLQKEEDHLEDFAPEVAWVTRSGSSDLEEPIAIRPTSETIMYPAVSKWIRSHRDLPLRLNQWTNVVRWEFKSPTPFLRTREFLWQEGHTAFATKEEADVEVIQVLDRYARVYEELLAVPVIKGRKSSKEKFPGGDYTTTIEAFIPGAGRAIQAATSHSLGQNFSKMFDISFTSAESTLDNPIREFAWQNSWGLTTRTIGVMIMVHGDSQGLVLPPRVAPLQVVGMTIPMKDEEEAERMSAKMDQLVAKIKGHGRRVKFDSRRDKNPGWKFNYWEQRGVPLRIELGPKDLAANTCVVVRRDNGAKETISIGTDEEVAAMAARCSELLDQIQVEMLERARKERDSRLSIAWTWEEFVEALKKGNLVLAPWCMTTASEDWVKDETKRISEELKAASGKTEEATEGEESGEFIGLTGAAKTLCIPFVQPPLPEGTMCFTGNGSPAVEWCLWGRSY